MKPKVKSWDLYDTLIAKRNGQETDVFRIEENARKVAPEDIIVSDMWMSPERLRELSGFENRMFVTDYGKGNGTIWPTVLAEYDIELHTGDNVKSDFHSPRQQRIPAKLDIVARTPLIEEIVGLKFPALAATMRETRLRTFDEKHRELELLQIEANFPLLFLASLKIQRMNIDGPILMSARDCYHWVKIMQYVQELHGKDITATYFPTSRIAKLSKDLSYLKYVKGINPGAIVDIGGTGYSSSVLKADAGISPEIIHLVAYPSSESEVIGLLIRDKTINLEICNLAPHSMFDQNRNLINPIGINWHIPEITVQENAIDFALDIASRYDFSKDIQASDIDIDVAMAYTYKELGRLQRVNDCVGFARQFLIEEDNWVMRQIKK